ncbi:MAG TPA: hypothetical protein VGN21_08330 [Stellaceae bacterium]
MPLDNLAVGLQRGFVQPVRELAKAAADGGYQAALLQHPAGDKSASPARPPDLFPKAEDCARRNNDSVQRGGGAPQILYLS